MPEVFSIRKIFSLNNSIYVTYVLFNEDKFHILNYPKYIYTSAGVLVLYLIKGSRNFLRRTKKRQKRGETRVGVSG